MNKLTLTLFGGILLLSGCSPHVGRMLTKTFPPQDEDAVVEIYTDETDIPVDSETLGVINVRDGGFTTKCDSTTVIELIKSEARHAGGNGVFISEHIRPSIWGSSCHQMTGTLLKIHDFSTTLRDNPEYLKDSVSFIHAKAATPDRKLPRMKIVADAGYGFRTAELVVDSEMREFSDKLMSAPTWDASFGYYFCDYFGVGAMYSAYSASNKSSMYYNDEANSYTEHGTGKQNDLIIFAGPAFLIRFSSHPKWIFDCNFGVGYMGYKSKFKFTGDNGKKINIDMTGATVGVQAVVGAEYRLSKNWGIGTTIVTTSGTLNSATITENGTKYKIKYDDDNEEGLGHLSFNLGLRFYIN